jgi:hypothetical protein
VLRRREQTRFIVCERRRSRRAHRAIRARDVRAADLQEKPTKRLGEPSCISATVVSLGSTKTAAPGEHRSERSEPKDRASLRAKQLLLLDAVGLVDRRNTTYGTQHVIQVGRIRGLEGELGAADAVLAGGETRGQDIDVLIR